MQSHRRRSLVFITLDGQTKTGQDAVEVTYLTSQGTTVVRRVEAGAAQLVDTEGAPLLSELDALRAAESKPARVGSDRSPS